MNNRKNLRPITLIKNFLNFASLSYKGYPIYGLSNFLYNQLCAKIIWINIEEDLPKVFKNLESYSDKQPSGKFYFGIEKSLGVYRDFCVSSGIDFFKELYVDGKVRNFYELEKLYEEISKNFKSSEEVSFYDFCFYYYYFVVPYLGLINLKSFSKVFDFHIGLYIFLILYDLRNEFLPDTKVMYLNTNLYNKEVSLYTPIRHIYGNIFGCFDINFLNVKGANKRDFFSVEKEKIRKKLEQVTNHYRMVMTYLDFVLPYHIKHLKILDKFMIYFFRNSVYTKLKRNIRRDTTPAI